MEELVVVGGGPGGLMAARLIEQQSGPGTRVTVFEQSRRVGGKVRTRRFATAPCTYESGVGSAVALGGHLLPDDDALRRLGGAPTAEAVIAFRERLSAGLGPEAWHRGFAIDHNDHPWAHCSAEDLLDEVPDRLARRYLRCTSHSDLASEPPLVNGLVGARNFLKAVPGYGAQYTLAGGMQQLPRRLAARLTRTTLRLGTRVTAIDGDDASGYTLALDRNGRVETARADGVVVALPYYQLRDIEWQDDPLRRAMARHARRYDPPGHYLRISMLFDEPFWRRHVQGAFFMLDSFGGCCVYDQSPADDAWGVLGWLLAGADALARCNDDDQTLKARALASLPAPLALEAQRRLLETRVDRWAGAVSANPGGLPLQDPRSAHQPEPQAHARLAVVGDYLFDSTLNGVWRSAGIATELCLGRAADTRSWPGLVGPASRTEPVASSGRGADQRARQSGLLPPFLRRYPT
jgi:predicted NAD/FAD-dependent oxidoreductase